MENNMNQANASQATSYEQDSANRTQNSGQQNGGMMDTLTSSLSNIQLPEAVKNVQLPQAVKDFGATCARTYNGLSTTQKVIGGAALALGASYWAATSQGWMGLGKKGKIKTASTGKRQK
ncbi:MAG: hypothetical protein ACO1OQ_09930 [Rufibacter sp.]